jgi:hypothetical protein
VPGNRDKTGRFVPGNNANPSGRPPVQPGVKEVFASHSLEAAEKLVSLMRKAKDERVQCRAAETILDRHLGRVPVAKGGEETSTEVLARFLAALLPQQSSE